MGGSWRQWLERLPDPDLIPVYRRIWGTLALVVLVVGAAASLPVLTPATAALAFASCFGMVFTVAGLYAVAFEKPWWSPVSPSLVVSILFVDWVALVISAGWFSLLLVIVVFTAPRLLSALHGQLGSRDRLPGRPSVRQLVRERAWRDVHPDDARWPWGDQW